MKRSQELFAGAKKHLVSGRARLSDQIKTLDAKRSAITNALRKMGIDKDDTLDVCISATWYRIQVQVCVRKLESFKDSRLTNLLNRLEDLNPRDVECGEWADYLEIDNFTYRITQKIKANFNKFN